MNLDIELEPTPAPTPTATMSPSQPPTSVPSQSPSRTPSHSPFQLPTLTPSQSSIIAPSAASTNFYCDSGVQTNETYHVCLFLLYFDDMANIFDQKMNDNSLHKTNYCILQSYFNCSQDSNKINGIFLNDANISKLSDE